MVSTIDALALTAGFLWALGWCAVGGLVAWWVALGGFFLGGTIGWFLALLGFDLFFYRPPPTSKLGILLELASFLLGLAAFLILPVAAFVLVRAA